MIDNVRKFASSKWNAIKPEPCTMVSFLHSYRHHNTSKNLFYSVFDYRSIGYTIINHLGAITPAWQHYNPNPQSPTLTTFPGRVLRQRRMSFAIGSFLSHFKLLVFLFTVLFSSYSAFSQSASSQWALTVNASSSITGNVTATSQSGGTGIGAISYAATGSGSQGWNSVTLDLNDYYQYSVSPQPGNSLQVKLIQLEHGISNANMTMAVYYSLDGFATAGIQVGANQLVNTTLSTFSQSTTIQVNDGQTFTMRVYGWNANQASAFFFNRNVLISGTTCTIPNAFNITGGGAYCAGGAGVEIGLNNSESGIDYQLFLGGNPVGSVIAGTGSAISFGYFTTAGTYTATGTRSASGCSSTMNGNAVIVVNPLPTLTSASQSAAVCENNPATINLSGLVANSVFNLDYTINGVAQPTIPGINASNSGTSSFSTGTLTFANNGQHLVITGLTITSSTPSCSSVFAIDVVLQVMNHPVITTCPASMLTSNVSAGSCSATVTYSVVASGSPVPTYSYIFSGATIGAGAGTGSGSVFQTGITVVKVIASNSCGNDTCSFNIQVLDNLVPSITCPVPAASYTTDLNTCTAALSFTATATDNCSVQSLKYYLGGVEIVFPYNFPKGVSTVTAIATDPSGNSSQCTFNVNVIDAQLPTISCPANQTRSTNNAGCTYLVSGNEFNPLSFADNCPGATITNNYNNSSTLANAVFPLGFTLVTWTVKDASNNTAVCSFGVTITDSQGPTLVNCPSNMTVNTGVGRTTCNQVATWTPPTATDNCTASGSIVITSNYSPGATFPVGATTVTYTATDASGNTSTCSFVVTVVDNTVPTFTAPNNITIYLDANCNYNAGIAFTGDVTNEFDNCTPTGLQATYTDDPRVALACPGTYTIRRVWRLQDSHGNVTTHDQTITVADNTKPVLTVPADITIQCNASTAPANTGQATATDNSSSCGGTVSVTYVDVTSAGSCASNSNIVRTWRAADCSGNNITGIQNIHLVDNTPPTGSVTNITVPCPANIPLPNTAIVTASDNCGPVSVVFYDEIPYGLEGQPGYCPNRVDRIYRVTDQCGNYTDVTQIITVQSLCGCSPCATSNAFYTVDLLGEPTGSITIPNVVRKDKCCDATKNYCASFNVRVDDDAVGVQILIDGAAPNPMDWKIDCQGVPINNGIVCIPGGSFHLFTFCKPGNNANTFTFISIAGVVTSNNITARVSCGTQITVTGNITNPVWNSISPGSYGQYNSYLVPNNTTLNPTFVPNSNSPATILYQICGNIGNFYCSATGTDCDTITVHVVDSIHIALNVDPSKLCLNSNTVLQATVTPLSTYQYQWFNAFNAGGTQVASGPTFQPTIPGQYSLLVTDIQTNFPCGTKILNFTVGFDQTPPVVTPPPNLTLQCNDPNSSQIINTWLAQAKASDDGGLTFLTVTNNYSGIIQACGTSLTVTFSAADACGNIGTATASINVIDTQVPTWLSPAGDLDRTVFCSDPASLVAAQALSPIPYDQCNPNVVITKTAGAFSMGSCPEAGTYTNTWIASDNCSNTSTVYTQVITVIDNLSPTWNTMPGTLNRNLDCSDVAGLAAAQALQPTATDNCHPAIVPVKVAGPFVPGVCANSGTYTNTWTATDACGNTGSVFTQVITISDVTPPLLSTSAQNQTVECDGAGNLVALNNWLSNNGGATATDACDNSLTWTNNFTTLSDLCGTTGSATVTFTAVDNCNNTVQTSATFSILDTQSPVINCPVNVTGYMDPLTCTGASINLGTATATDACSSSVTITNNAPAAGFPVGVTTVTWTATDACGNSSTCSQLVTVLDTIPPTSIVCPPEVAANASTGACGANVTVPPPVASDPCGPVTIINNYTNTSNASGFYPVGVTTVVWTISDTKGNSDTCIQLVTITDTQAPTISCPPDVVAIATPPLCQVPSIVVQNPVYSDNCPNPVLTWIKTGATIGTGSGLVNNTSFNVGLTVVTYIVTDASGNTDSCSFNVRVNDQVPPTIITCPPATINAFADLGACTANLVIPAPVVSDPCGEIISVSNSFNGTGNASGAYPVGVTTVIWTITDESSNTVTCTQVITVTDNQNPTITCPPDVVALATPPLCQVPSIIVQDPVYSDNCPNPILTWIKTGVTTGSGSGLVSNTTFNVGLTVVTYIITDASGNSDSCSFNVRINDQVPPTIISCPPATINASTDPGQCSANLTIPAPSVIDPCGEILSVVNNYNGTNNASGIYPTGVTTVVWTITDESLNTVTCTQVVTVTDNQLPAITCPADVIAVATPPLCQVPSIVVQDPVYSDNCPNPVLTWVKTGATTGSGIGLVNNTTFNVGLTVVTYTVTDASGNTASCSFNVRINDQVPPTIISCPQATINASADPGMCSADLIIPVPDVIDSCGEIVSVINSYNGTGNASGTYPVGVTTVIWTIMDESANIVSCTQVITVTDNQLPTITCPPDVVAVATPPLCQVPAIVVQNPVYSDNCPNPTLSWTKTGATTGSGTGLVNNTSFNVGLTVVTYTVTDSSGNTASCSFNVRVNDQVPPTIITCPSATINASTDPGQCSANLTIPTPNVIDPCGEIVSVVNNFNGTGNASGIYPVGTTTVVWTITDESGNAVTCTQLITVTDNQFPTISCPPDVVAIATPPSCQVPAIVVQDPVYSDNCPNPVLSWTKTGATTGTGTGLVGNTTFNVGLTIVTYSVTDASGNTDTCSFRVRINDQVPPTVITCPADLTVNAPADSCEATLAVPAPVVVDPCQEIVSITHNSPYGISATNASGTYPVGSYTVTWTFTDESGNQSTCTQLITVLDVAPPVLVCPPDFSVQADFEKTYASNVPIPAPTYSDGCSVQTLTWVMSGATSGASPLTGINIVTVQTLNVGVTTFTYTATDPSGNTVSCSFNVTVLSEPVISCPPDIITNADPGVCSATIDPGQPTLISGAGPISWSWSMSGATTANGTGNPIVPIPYTFNVGVTTITWIAANFSGADTCSMQVTVIDNQPPTFTAPGPFSFCVESIDSAVYYDPTMDIQPDRPEYYTFVAGSTVLDIDPSTIIDNCGLTCTPEIRWRIDFNDGTSIPAAAGQFISGQPSTYGSNIQFPGIITGNLIHTITYQIVDCSGNATPPQVVDITITPRPNVIKQ